MCRNKSPLSVYTMQERVTDANGPAVYHIRHNQSGKDCTMSQIDQVSDFERDLVKSEVNLIESLASDNIVKCVELFDHGNTLYVVNEFLGGGQLS